MITDNQVEQPTNEQAQASTKPAVDTAQMEAAAKEASMMLLNRVIDEEQAQAQKVAQKAAEEKPAEEKPQAEKKSPKPKEKAKAKEEPKAEEADPEPEEKPEEKPAPRLKRNRVNPKEVAELAAKSAAEAAAETMRQLEEQRAAREEKASAKPELDIPDDLSEDVERLKEVQRLHAKDYKGRDLVAELLESTKREREYEKKWRRENPGQEFDWSDEEHARFAQDNAVEVDEDHLKEAEKSLIKEAAIREAEERFAKKYGQDIEEIRRQKVEAELAPVRRQVDVAASKGLLEAVRPDLVEQFDNDPKAVVEAIKEDPIAAEAVSAVERWSLPALDAAVRVINNPSGYTEKSKEVQMLAKAALHVDRLIATVEPENRPVAEDGRRFSTLKDYQQMPAHRRAQYYTVQDETLIIPLMVKAAQLEASRTKEALEKRAEAYAKRMGFVRTGSETSQKAESKPAQKTPAASAPSVKATPNVPEAPKPDQGSIDGLPSEFLKRVGLVV